MNNKLEEFKKMMRDFSTVWHEGMDYEAIEDFMNMAFSLGKEEGIKKARVAVFKTLKKATPRQQEAIPTLSILFDFLSFGKEKDKV